MNEAIAQLQVEDNFSNLIKGILEYKMLKLLLQNEQDPEKSGQ